MERCSVWTGLPVAGSTHAPQCHGCAWVVVHSCAWLVAGCLDGILRVSSSLCRGSLRNPMVVKSVLGWPGVRLAGEGLASCQGLGRLGGRRAGGRESRILPGVPGWGTRQYGRACNQRQRPRIWTERGSSHLGLSSVSPSHWSLTPKALCVV